MTLIGTKRVTEQDVFDFIVEFTLENGYQPDKKVIRERLQIAKKTVDRMVLSLHRKGSLRSVPGKIRAYEIPYLKNLLGVSRDEFARDQSRKLEVTHE